MEAELFSRGGGGTFFSLSVLLYACVVLARQLMREIRFLFCSRCTPLVDRSAPLGDAGSGRVHVPRWSLRHGDGLDDAQAVGRECADEQRGEAVHCPGSPGRGPEGCRGCPRSG